MTKEGGGEGDMFYVPISDKEANISILRDSYLCCTTITRDAPPPLDKVGLRSIKVPAIQSEGGGSGNSILHLERAI